MPAPGMENRRPHQLPDRRLSIPELFLPTQETQILRKTGQVSKYFFSGRFDLESAG